MAGNQRSHPPAPAAERTLNPSGAQPLQLAIAGLGAIGTEVARAVRSGEAPGVEVAAVVEPVASPVRDKLAAAGVPIHTDLATLEWECLDAVLEAASQAALRLIAPSVLSRGVDLVALSAGTTLDPDFLASLVNAAQTSGARIWVPSGAIGALDVVRAARVGEVESITLTTTKPPIALADAPWVVEQGIDLSEVSQPRVIFSGGPVEAVRGFPQNVNVAALLTLAADDSERVRVTVVADPAAPGNVHEVEVLGSFGTMRLRLENRPSETNPKTSALAAQSVIALLRQLGSPLRFG